jgi:ribosomal protein S18 acetylase RimI-like enzyme
VTSAPVLEPISGRVPPVGRGAVTEPVDAPAVTIRPAEPGDRAAIVALGRRCSAETLRRRFHGATAEFPTRYLDWMLDPANHSDNLVAVAGDDIVGLASNQETSSGHGELAVLVEDAWQHHHLGTRLVRRLAARALARHDDLLVASVMADNQHALALLHSSGAQGAVTFDGSVVLVSVSLDEQL